MLTPLLLVLLLPSAPLPDSTARDGLLVEAAVVPRPGTVRFSTEGGALPAETAGKSDPQVSVSVLWTVGAGVAAGVEATNDGGKLSPAVSLRYQFASQESAPANGVALVRFKSVGFSPSGTEVEAEAVLGRSFGRFGLTLAGVAGRGFGADDAVDLEVKTAVAWNFSDDLRAQLEGRYRSELRPGAETAQLAGREYDALAGPALTWHVDDVEVQAIAGWGVPRGTAPAGPMALALVSFDL